MRDITDFLACYAEKHNMNLIVETTNGLNVDRDEPYTRGHANDRDCIFYNIIESGVFNVISDRKLQITHNYEIGFFKRCYKEVEGEEYYKDLKYLLNVITDLMKELYREYELSTATYDTGVDSLDDNDVAIRLNISIIDIITIC